MGKQQTGKEETEVSDAPPTAQPASECLRKGLAFQSFTLMGTHFSVQQVLTAVHIS